MKKVLCSLIFIISLFIVNVKADMGPPMIAEHKVMVTNKDGAVCYTVDEKGNYKKDNKTIPYKTILKVSSDISGSYINVYDNDEGIGCDVKYSDVSAVTQNFDLNDKEKSEEITPVKAVVLAKGGLNMRKGPSVTYSKLMTVPEHAIITLTRKSGTYWYYCEYKGTKGWITGMNGYIGYEGKEVLYNYEEMKIYSNYDRKTVVGKIPANTEITNYLNLVTRSNYDISHFVIYNGVKGYIDKMLYKTDGVGKIKLTKNYDITTDYGELIKKLTPQELEYTMVDSNGAFYLPEKKIVALITEDSFEFVKKVDILNKTTGYIGEGLFGEEKQEIVATPEPANEESHPIDPSKETLNNGLSTKEIIIIGLLAGIFLALTAMVIIKLVNGKKKQVVVKTVPAKDEYQEAREIIEKRVNNEVKMQEEKLAESKDEKEV